MNLTANITFEEMTNSSHTALVIQNRWDAQAHMPSITTTAVMLQRVRDHFGKPVIIHSGYRNAELDRAVGGVNGQHPKGEAVDFHIQGVDLVDVYAWIVDESGILYGQCLLERHGNQPATWIHLSLGEPWRTRNNRDHHEMRA